MDFEQKLKYIYALFLDPLRSLQAQYTLNTVGRTSVVGSLSDKDIILNHSIFTYNSHPSAGRGVHSRAQSARALPGVLMAKGVLSILKIFRSAHFF